MKEAQETEDKIRVLLAGLGSGDEELAGLCGEMLGVIDELRKAKRLVLNLQHLVDAMENSVG